MYNFSAKTVVVTGAAGALGQAVVDYFLRQGANVALIDISQAAFDASYANTAETDQQIFLSADLTSRSSVAEAFSAVINKWQQIDILANIAGGFTMGEAVHQTSDQTWDFLFQLNSKSIVHTAAVVVPHMQQLGGGKIINISAGAAHQGIANMGAYVASKSTVLRLTESMAQELRQDAINVNAILPGMIDTPRNRSDMPDADFSSWVPTQKIAEVIGFLASDAASEIHGAGLPVVGLS